MNRIRCDADRIKLLTNSGTPSGYGSTLELTLEFATINSSDSIEKGLAQLGSSANYFADEPKSKLG